MDSKINNKRTQLINRLIVIAAMAFTGSFGFAETPVEDSQQKTFAAGEEAVDAFITALKADNNSELLAIFGDDANELIFSGDPVLDRFRRKIFVEAYEEQHRLDTDANSLILVIGQNDWPFPIPLIKQQQRWIFDVATGKEEILRRRVGRNELHTIQTLLAAVDAQREYATKDRDGDGLLEYAQKFRSDPNSQNGLYWETGEGEEVSPLGVLVARAKRGGYQEKDPNEAPQPYLGYYYRMLTGQGENAAGGGFDYLVKDNMIGGFAVIAYPAEYANSGVMTFIVNHDGVVYQKNLGENTEEEAAKIMLFDPDKTWTKAEQE
jgi:hypothetical protein